MGLYDLLTGFQQKLGNIFPRVKRLGFTPALIGFKKFRYCGPGNSLDQPPATNRTDAICEAHDRSYDRVFNSGAPPQVQKQQIYDIDRQFRKDQQAVFKDKSRPLDERIVAKVSDLGIGAKMFFDRQSFEPASETPIMETMG